MIGELILLIASFKEQVFRGCVIGGGTDAAIRPLNYNILCCRKRFFNFLQFYFFNIYALTFLKLYLKEQITIYKPLIINSAGYPDALL
jgi:hypothetical protein